ncbi:hypothetical protein Cgig2_033441 [Carnegiea gigantea]|uniref:t-SNARE coiled-coil homology domain-containing protein n=1 Tax=Carnegiea gigantea TaxID=171969 RepID=A0A9Q1KVG3_9CARY|nr:hypothetical protein Cgig2_033441 [Carnegiea gigantea]
MRLVDIITRLDTICKKYDKYDVDKQRDTAAASAADDPFARFYSEFKSNVDDALQKSEAAVAEQNRAAAVAMFAEVKRLSREELEARNDLVYALKDRIESIPDGTPGPPKQTVGWAAFASKTGIRIDLPSVAMFGDIIQLNFVQDEGLDYIAEGLDTLKDMARAMDEEMDKQVGVLDEMDEKTDRAASDLKSTNVRLKDTLNKLPILYGSFVSAEVESQLLP